jgi:hypothetical protein
MLSDGSMERLVVNCIEFVPNHLKRDLRTYLSHQLETKTAAELKGILNREKRSVAFNSKAAKSFFEISLEKLAEKPC